jgi:hypothetical protein
MAIIQDSTIIKGTPNLQHSFVPESMNIIAPLSRGEIYNERNEYGGRV